jgi:hypothetical protein
MTILSRRDLIRSSGSLLGCLFTRELGAGSASIENLKINLARQFANTALRAISPDGTKLCLEDWKVPGYPLRVVDVGSGETIYTGRFQQRALVVSFFADSHAIFLDFAGGKEQLVRRQAVVDIRSGERTERMHAYDPFHYSEVMSPVSDRTLLVAHYELAPRHSMEWLAQLEFPSYREFAKTELPDQRGDSKVSADIRVSDDRNVAIYFFNNAVVCRRIQDLGVLWTHPVETGLRAFPLGVSAHGTHVAASIGKGTSDGQFEHYTALYVCVYEGKTGAEVARLPLSGAEGIAISPDGKLLAVVVREPGKKGELLPTVHIHDVASGARVASVVHDRIPSGRRQFLLAGSTVAFTSDGRYVITAGMITKVWRIGE